MQTLLSYERAKNVDRQTDRQTAFQLYIIEDICFGMRVVQAVLLYTANLLSWKPFMVFAVIHSTTIFSYALLIGNMSIQAYYCEGLIFS